MEMYSADHHSLYPETEKHNYILFYAISWFLIKADLSIITAKLGSLGGWYSLF